MGIDEIIQLYSHGTTIENGSVKNDPIHMKWAGASWLIQDVWGAQQNEKISLGKARELTSAIIEGHLTGQVSFWVIEKAGNIYLKHWDDEPLSVLSWTFNIHEAYKLGNKEAAEYFIKMFECEAQATEHSISLVTP